MNKLISTLIVILFSWALSSATQAQGSYTLYTSSDGTPIIEGYTDCDSLLKFPRASGLTGPAQTIVYWGDGSSDTYPMTPSSSGVAEISVDHHYSTPGVYTVLFELQELDGTLMDIHTESVTAICNRVYGLVYKRNDANCTFNEDADEIQHIIQHVEVKKGGVAVDTVSTYSGAHFSYIDPAPSMGVVYELNLLDNGLGLTQVCGPITFILDTIGIHNNRKNLAYECSGAEFDNQVALSGFFRTVDTTRMTLKAYHVSCTGPDAAVVTLNVSPKYSFFSATIPPTSVAGSLLTWTLPSLFTQEIELKFLPVGVLTSGDTAEFIANITPVAGDINDENNEFVLNQEISAAWDPNNKIANPGQVFTSGDYIYYTINFENLGNDTAFNVHVMDTLSAHVIPSSLEVLESSHNMYTYHKTYGEVSVVKFDFPRIRLADIDHPESNKGYVTYRILTESGLPISTEVENTAHIYFDVNPAVVTNTTVNEIPAPSSLPELSNVLDVNIYPNPAQEVLHIKLPQGEYDQAFIVNALGQVMATKSLTSDVNNWNISPLNHGVYYLIIEVKGSRYAHKFVKQ